MKKYLFLSILAILVITFSTTVRDVPSNFKKLSPVSSFRILRGGEKSISLNFKKGESTPEQAVLKFKKLRSSIKSPSKMRSLFEGLTRYYYTLSKEERREMVLSFLKQEDITIREEKVLPIRENIGGVFVDTKLGTLDIVTDPSYASRHPNSPYQIEAGAETTNAAIAVASLGYKGIKLIRPTGTGTAGEVAKRTLEKYQGINTHFVDYNTDDHPFIVLTSNLEKVLYPSRNPHSGKEKDNLLSNVEKVLNSSTNKRFLLIGGSSAGVTEAIPEILIKGKKKGLKTGVIVEDSWSDDILKKVVKSKPDVMTMNKSGFIALYEGLFSLNEAVDSNNFSEIMRKMSVLAGEIKGVVAVTLGGEGAMAATPEETYWVKSVKKISVRTVFRCGDAFTGYFMLKILQGKSVKEALKFATSGATAKARIPGPVMPDRRQYNELSPEMEIITEIKN